MSSGRVLDRLGFRILSLTEFAYNDSIKDVFYACKTQRNLIYMKNSPKVRFHTNKVSIGKDNKGFDIRRFVSMHDLFCITIIDTKNNNIEVSEHSLGSLSECDL